MVASDNRRNAGRTFLIGLWMLAAAECAWAQLPTARLDGIYPAGGQRDTSIEVVVAGTDLDDVHQLHFSHPGITAEQKMSDPGPFDDGPQVVPNTFVLAIADGVPAGWGAPLYGKLDQDLASALMSINAVKGVEIGDGFAAAGLSGEDNADEIQLGNDGQPRFTSNHAGGILGGISTGQQIIARFAVKPTSSILTPRATIDRHGNETQILTKGRHDPCVGIRAVPVGEAMVALVLADHFLRHRAQTG